MGVFEPGRVFQSVADRSVNTDVREPDQRDLNRNVCVGDHTDSTKSDWAYVGVDGVVASSPDARPGEISHCREVGSERECDKKPPGVVRMEVEGDCGGRDGEPFSTKQDTREPI